MDALARALKLDHDEHEHLRALAARAARYAPEPPAAPGRTVRPQLKLLLETLRPNPGLHHQPHPGHARGQPGALALYAGIDDWPLHQRNIGRFLFLHPAARELYADWDKQVRGVRRPYARPGRHRARRPRPGRPNRRTAAQEPRIRQAMGTLRRHHAAPPRQTKTFHHPQVGTITLGFQGMQLEGTPGQRLGVYMAEPGTPDYDAMILLDMTAPAAAAEKPTAQQRDCDMR